MTCRHYRFQIPRADADELRATDVALCLICDSRAAGNFQMINWSAVVIRPEGSSWLETIRASLAGWLQWGETPLLPTPTTTSPASRLC